MRFGPIDATEATLTMMAVMIFTSIVGSGAWGTKVRNYANSCVTKGGDWVFMASLLNQYH